MIEFYMCKSLNTLQTRCFGTRKARRSSEPREGAAIDLKLAPAAQMQAPIPTEHAYECDSRYQWDR